MFKHIKAADQLRAAQAEITRLKGIVGEGAPAEEHEGEMAGGTEGHEAEKVSLTDRIQALEAMELENILGGGF